MNKIVFLLFLLTLAMNVTAEKTETWTSDSVPKKIKMCWHNAYPYAASDMEDGGFAADFTSTVMAEAGFEQASHYFYDSLFWASQPKQAVKT